MFLQNALDLTVPASNLLLLDNNSSTSTAVAESSAVCDKISNYQETTTATSAAVTSAQATNCRTAAINTTPQQSAQPLPQSWFQLSGHPDCFAPAGLGTIWKKCSGGTERDVYEALSNEPSLQDIVPKYYREVEYNGQTFIELQDLLSGFRDPNVMDIKMGTRTFLESEVKNTTARKDLYLKVRMRKELPPSPFLFFFTMWIQ